VAGRIIAGKGPHDQPHYHVHVKGTDGDYDIAINIESTASVDGSPTGFEVLYDVNNSFTPPNAAGLKALTASVTLLSADSGLALDYVRVPGLVTRAQMILLPISETSATSALHSLIDTLIQKAITQKATIYAFGQSFGNGSGANPFFGFSPDQGIHDIHMNQGNPEGPHGNDNGTFTDGGLFVEFPDGTWSAAFIAFQSQSFNTDDDGNPTS
jgi:uncharacterized protein YukJ